MFNLTGLHAVVTGAAGGIGYEIAKALRSQGASVTIADLNSAAGQASAKELDADFVYLDVASSPSVEQAVQGIIATHGRIDIWVNNAGIVRNSPATDTPNEEWQAIMDVNLNGVFYCCREVGKHMVAHGSGSIINIASMSGLISNYPQPQAAYNASKAAVIHLTKSLAGEWAKQGVRVNAIAPGYVATPLTKKGLETPEWRDVWLATIPQGRLAEPEEIAPCAVFLASREASYVTGSTLVVDGGYTVW